MNGWEDLVNLLLFLPFVNWYHCYCIRSLNHPLMESSSFSGSSKRAKAPGNITQVAHCLVDGCNADLSLCRDYHRRHKVCEAHSKTPMVTIGGREQRFCQQCSRFHSLIEFDEGKRSCRKRLDGHNRRRRKPQPDSVTRNTGLVFSAHQNIPGSTLLSFANPHLHPSSVVSSSWTGVVKDENGISRYNNLPQLNYMDRSNPFPECPARGMNQFQLVQGNGCHPNGVSGSSSDRALSLLSSAPPSITREFGLNHNVQTPDGEPLVHNHLQYGNVGQFQSLDESKPFVSPADSHGGDMATLHFPEMFHLVDRSSLPTDSGSHQTLTFRWE